MNRLLAGLILMLLPMLAQSQDTDPGSKAVRDSLARVKDSLRHTDSAHQVKKAADSSHYSDTTRYHWSYSGTGNINNTNTLNSYLLSNTVTVGAVRKKAALNFSNSWIYGAQGRNLTNNDFTSTADLSMYKTIRHFYYWGLLNYNTSLSLQINNLFQSGAGIGYNLLDKKTAAIILSDGVLYENGDLYQVHYGGPGGDATVRDRYQVFRNSFRLKYHFVINNRITLDGIELIQHSLVTIHNYILNLSASASVKMNKWLSLMAALNHNKFTRTRSENTLVTFGINIVR